MHRQHADNLAPALSIDREATMEDGQNTELYQPLVDIAEMQPRPHFERPLEFHPIWGSVYSLPIDSGELPISNSQFLVDRSLDSQTEL